VGSPCHPLRGSFEWRIGLCRKNRRTAKSIASRGDAELAPVHWRTFCRCPSAVSGGPRVAWLAPEAGAHRGLAIMPSPRITYETENDRNVSGS
jgi:hypothetical protein